MPDPSPLILHATTVAVDGAGLLIRGAAGCGKSTLALEMIALGAGLVADDRTCLTCPDAGAPVAEAPQPLRGLIEARGLGLLRVPAADRVRLAAVLDLDAEEGERLPHLHRVEICGRRLPLLRRVRSPAFAAALVLFLRGGRAAP